MAEKSNGNGDTNDNGGSAGGQELQQTLDTTRGLLEANLDAGVPAQEALENSRPRNWQS